MESPAARPVDPVVVMAYDGVAADEARVIVDVLMAAGMPVVIASVGSNPVTSYHGRMAPMVDAGALGPLSALVVPGGMGVLRARDDRPLLDAISRLAASARWLAATSTGSVLLGAAGAVTGARVTTHWLAGDLAAEEGLTLVPEPLVEYGRLLTASGVASSRELALRLTGALLGAGAEAAARSRHQPESGFDPRYHRTESPVWWRFGSRRRITPLPHPLDRSGRADVVLLDLDLAPGPDPAPEADVGRTWRVAPDPGAGLRG